MRDDLEHHPGFPELELILDIGIAAVGREHIEDCLLYTSDAADERSSVDLGGRRILKKQQLISATTAAISNPTQETHIVVR